MVVAAGLFSIDQAGKDWSYAGMPPKWLLLGAGLAGIQVRLAIHTFRDHPRPWRDARLSDFQHRPVNDVQPFLCPFTLSTVIFVIALSIILFIVDVLYRERWVGRKRMGQYLLYRFYIDNDATLNVARKLRLIARKYT